MIRTFWKDVQKKKYKAILFNPYPTNVQNTVSS